MKRQFWSPAESEGYRAVHRQLKRYGSMENIRRVAREAVQELLRRRPGLAEAIRGKDG